jgi:hypothetical protein
VQKRNPPCPPFMKGGKIVKLASMWRSLCPQSEMLDIRVGTTFPAIPTLRELSLDLFAA